VNCEIEFHLPKFRDAISVSFGKGVSTSLLLDTGLVLLGCSPLECLEGSASDLRS